MPAKILFVIPRNKSLFGDSVNLTGHPHIGVAYLASFLKQKGIEVDIFDEGIEFKKSILNERIQAFKPQIIGVTIFSYCYGFVKNLLEYIKARFDIPVVAGGPHVSAVRSEILVNPHIDFGVKHEGEYTLLELLEEIKKPHPEFATVKGLIWRSKDKVVENPDRTFIENLDTLPFPDYEVFGIKKYPCFKHKILPLITSRGCPFGCNYCSVRLSMGQRFRPRSAENVFQEIKHFYDAGWHNFDFNDDCFTLDRKRAKHICDCIIENHLTLRFQLYNGIRVDTVDEELLQKMKEAGCYFISYGCEAGNEKVLKVIKKGITLYQVRRAVALTNKVGIPNSVNFIIGHKEETYEDALDTIHFADELPTRFVNFYNLLPYPGTESFAWAKQHAHFLIPPDEFLENISYRDNRPVFETAEFTKPEREKIVAMGFDLYRKKILTFRLGYLLGMGIYWLTKSAFINKHATRFALTNPLGRLIYIGLAKKSFETKKEGALSEDSCT